VLLLLFYSAFHGHSKLFNDDQNLYPKMSLKWTLGCNFIVWNIYWNPTVIVCFSPQTWISIRFCYYLHVYVLGSFKVSHKSGSCRGYYKCQSSLLIIVLINECMIGTIWRHFFGVLCCKLCALSQILYRILKFWIYFQIK
jgi:hypothetical protein